MDDRDRLGLNIPYEWWPTSPLLKEIEACGFGWVQIPSPPPSLLAESRSCIAHARAAARSLATTGLRSVFHAPTSLLAGERESDRVFAGAISYAAECGAEQIVYHARARPEDTANRRRLAEERRSLERLVPVAERLGIVIAIENLAPVYPGREFASAIPQTLRDLAHQLDSPSVRLCLDLGHANVIAGLRRTSIAGLVEPVLDSVSLFHIHDNLGARWQASDQRQELDPLRLDLHLAPGRGSLDWGRVAPALRRHTAPLILEVHPPHRPSPAELHSLALAALSAQRPALA